ncbi:MAG TPA: peptidylprolyl isomerase [Candidatus Acidoferrum sp.]|nr:peptidylprolyl isomerase [Candidatus Acidoferrum sp.]
MHLKSCALAATALLLSIPALSQTPAPAKPKSTTTTTTAAKPASTATYDHALLKPALLKDKAPETYQVKFDTTRGEFTMTITRAWAPLAADRFYNLVKHHFFDNSRFFRVSPGFVVQFGLSGTPAVNAAWEKATIKDEPVNQKNVRGTITFAKTAAPNSRGTQLFINLKDNTFLDSQGFAPFGVVDGKGINVVEMMYDQYGDAAGVNDQENITKGGEKYIVAHYPKLDTIKSATLVGAAAAPAKPAAKPATAAKPAAKPQ